MTAAAAPACRSAERPQIKPVSSASSASGSSDMNRRENSSGRPQFSSRRTIAGYSGNTESGSVPCTVTSVFAPVNSSAAAAYSPSVEYSSFIPIWTSGKETRNTAAISSTMLKKKKDVVNLHRKPN